MRIFTELTLHSSQMVFRSAISSSSSSSSSSTLILHRQLPSPSSCEVGELLLRDWRSKALLLSLTRELEAYLSSSGE